MQKVRVIPTLLWKDFGLVKGVGFDSWRRVGSVLPAIRVYKSRDVDELVVVDIVASRAGDTPDHDSVADFSEEASVPLTVGGGISTLDEIVKLLHAGADKVSINTAAYEHPELINEASGKFGAQCVVASIDARGDGDSGYECCSYAGSKPTGKDPVEWAREMADRGAGEILLTSIDRDGTMEGYDLKLIESVTKAVSIPVIASGGAGNYEHMIQAVNEAGASAVAAASIFHFTEMTPAGAKEAMAAAGIAIRKNYRAEL